MAGNTKDRLSKALKHQLLTNTLDRITVTALTDECHINRQTFYYHFHDIYELLEWTIKKEATAFGAGRDCREVGEMLDRISEFAAANEAMIIHAYRPADRYFAKKFLEEGLRPVITEMVEAKTAGRKISAEDKCFMTDVFVFTLIGVTMKWLDSSMSYSLIQKKDKMMMLMNGNVDEAISRFSSDRL